MAWSNKLFVVNLVGVRLKKKRLICFVCLDLLGNYNKASRFHAETCKVAHQVLSQLPFYNERLSLVCNTYNYVLKLVYCQNQSDMIWEHDKSRLFRYKIILENYYTNDFQIFFDWQTQWQTHSKHSFRRGKDTFFQILENAMFLAM